MENAQQVDELRSTQAPDAAYPGRRVPADWFLDPADPAAGRRLQDGVSLEDQATAFLAIRDDAEADAPAATVTALHPGGAAPQIAEDPSDRPTEWLGLPGLADPRDIDGELVWQVDALCAQTDPEAFFPEKGGSTRDAKMVCGACTVRAECLEYALGNDERFGIWGGLSERERRRLRKRTV